MKITLESTTKVVTLNGPEGTPAVEARVWEGVSDAGVPVIAFVTRIRVAMDRPPLDHALFERELLERRAPSADVAAFPARMIL